MEAGREGELMKRGPFFSDRNSEIRTCQDKRYGRWEVRKKGEASMSVQGEFISVSVEGELVSVPSAIER